MNRILFAALLLGTELTACVCSAQPPTSLPPELSAIEENSHLQAWFESWDETLPGLLASAFQIKPSNPFPEQGAHRSALAEGNSLRGCCWTAVVASPDGQHAVGWTPRPQEPHSDIYLIDAIHREAVRVFQCGTPCTYEQVIWLDPRRFVLAGVFESSWKRQGNSSVIGYSPTLVLFDLATSTTTQLIGPEISSKPGRSQGPADQGGPRDPGGEVLRVRPPTGVPGSSRPPLARPGRDVRVRGPVAQPLEVQRQVRVE